MNYEQFTSLSEESKIKLLDSLNNNEESKEILKNHLEEEKNIIIHRKNMAYYLFENCNFNSTEDILNYLNDYVKKQNLKHNKKIEMNETLQFLCNRNDKYVNDIDLLVIDIKKLFDLHYY
jgi:hypothetical protein